ncbi:MAG: hypothetical protein K8E66_05595 [Phycisphaerales bacterium]|nr:hypothetical protein [Phycisphaerales bacterium]
MAQTESPRTRPSRRPGLTPLIALNAALVGGLAFVEFGPLAQAQPGEPREVARPRGEYTLVGGKIQTGNSDAVYIIDSVNQEMIVLRWEDGRNILSGIGYRDLDADSKARTRR